MLDSVPNGDYSRLGSSWSCPDSGRGGLNANNVYRISNAPSPISDYTYLPYSSLGCFVDNDDVNRSRLRNQEGTDPLLDGNPFIRLDAINKCYQVAKEQGHNTFGVQNGACFSQMDYAPGGFYTINGNTSFCPNDGYGGFFFNHVYRIKDIPQISFDWSKLNYTTMGCYLIPTFTRPIIPSNEGRSTTITILDGDYRNRTDAINKCFRAANSLNHNIFALYRGGECLSMSDYIPGGDYNKHGVSGAYCPVDGKGGLFVMHLYRVTHIPSKVFTMADLVTLPRVSR
jgi:C-type mannose receptor